MEISSLFVVAKHTTKTSSGRFLVSYHAWEKANQRSILSVSPDIT